MCCSAAFFRFGKSKNTKKVNNISMTINTIGDLFWAITKSCSGFGWSATSLATVDRWLIAIPFLTFTFATAVYMGFCKSCAKPDPEHRNEAVARLVTGSSDEREQQQRDVAAKHLYAWTATLLIIIVRGIIESILSSLAKYEQLDSDFLKETFPAILELVFFAIIAFQDSGKKCMHCCLPSQIQDERHTPGPADPSPDEHKSAPNQAATAPSFA
jgi:hypothetical protein